MSAWTTASSRTDLRNLLSDNPTDKLRYRKRLIGEQNGTNKRFKSLEFRRITDFKTEASISLGVFVAGARLDPATQIDSDGPEVGEVVLTTAPTNTQRVEGSYYIQWFKDAELDIFLKNAAQWLGLGDAVASVPDGLQPAALYFAAQEAYHKLAARWAEKLSETFRAEDMPKSEKAAMDSWRSMAKDAKEKSESLRKGFYERNDQAAAPLWGSNYGRVKPVVPRR